MRCVSPSVQGWAEQATSFSLHNDFEDIPFHCSLQHLWAFLASKQQIYARRCTYSVTCSRFMGLTDSPWYSQDLDMVHKIFQASIKLYIWFVQNAIWFLSTFAQRYMNTTSLPPGLITASIFLLDQADGRVRPIKICALVRLLFQLRRRPGRELSQLGLQSGLRREKRM